ncbi:11S globulin seed storage protein Ana o 2.0101-like [Mangifera indica]|uniref:11S globulin seed storage protein Ana o 2.0101-like n=1 Tax=Mangifera indica TaxID=29780 RepID=UPI001CFA769D|nr:11S globulin seed storage protein Ana o 2.0101-like [Mangifera indica]
MANPSLLSLSVCLLILLHGCLASRKQCQQQNQCQIDWLDALEPDNRVEYEAGMVETWDPNHEQFQCAGVAMVRHTIQPNGLLLPQFSNSPQLIYVVQGEGMTGILYPGCPETYQAPQQGQSGRFQDKHQKILRFRRGDIIALPAGVAHWCYNEGNSPVVTVTLLDLSNSENQLDMKPRKFHLAGNPQDEFQQQQQQKQSRGRKSSCNNVFCGFDTEILAEALQVDQRLAKQLKKEDNRGGIINVKGDELRVISPPMRQGERGDDSEEESDYEKQRRGQCDNGIEETICTMRMKENINDPARADIYTPEVGRITTLNSLNLPILKWLQLSAERGVLHNNALMVPYWNLNAHSIVYGCKGEAQVQVVDNMGNTVFDGVVREGQILVVPQNYAVAKRTREQRFEWVSFKTNDRAMMSPLAGPTSVIRATPDEVLANALQISREDARKIKYNNQQITLTRAQSSRRPRADA